MRYPDNILELSRLPIDFMGLIFYEKSPRYAGNLPPKTVRSLPPKMQKVGVFVNADVPEILGKIAAYDLQAVQLHGAESPELCRTLKNHAAIVIKAFPLSQAEDLKVTDLYSDVCDYFLFDTKTPQYGGSGKKFDWKILDGYAGDTPFFLSGGIDLEDIPVIRQLTHPHLFAIDLNSRFETVAGRKDIQKLQELFNLL
jgi:phosphoribosylanthranilate isomerase